VWGYRSEGESRRFLMKKNLEAMKKSLEAMKMNLGAWILVPFYIWF
jgi:hypothetical protein